MLDLEHLRDRPVNKLSGGELQRMAIALICIAEADIYMFDEPSSYLDVKQRLNAARVSLSFFVSCFTLKLGNPLVALLR